MMRKRRRTPASAAAQEAADERAHGHRREQAPPRWIEKHRRCASEKRRHRSEKVEVMSRSMTLPLIRSHEAPWRIHVKLAR